MRIVLKVTAGPHEGKEAVFSEHGTLIVGRSPKATFQLPEKDRYFSRVHFLVEVNPPNCRIVDLCSRNGTFVNGRRITAPTDLVHGDVIKAGHTRLEVALDGHDSTAGGTVTGDRASAADSVPLSLPPPEPDPEPRRHPRPSDDPVLLSLPPPEPEPAPRQADWRGKPAAAVERGPGTIKPGDVSSVPPANPGAVTPAAACRVCGLAGAPAPREVSGESRYPLCGHCLQKIRRCPQPFPGYRLVTELGRGAMGVVYKALHQADGAVVALKTITPTLRASEADIQRFLREADTLRALRHPKIIGFRDMGTADGRVFFVMDFVSGKDVNRLLKEAGQPGGGLPTRRAVRVVCQLLEALGYAHAKGYVHRDVKPANMLVVDEGGEDSLRLADFGLARLYHESSASGITLLGFAGRGGTPAFMPPDQITDFRNAKPAADIYSAGATLYTLLTDQFVFDFKKRSDDSYDPNDVFFKILDEKPVPIRSRRAAIPSGLAAVVHRCLEKDPKDRPEDAASLREALLPYGR